MPTGSGKTRIAGELAREALAAGERPGRRPRGGAMRAAIWARVSTDRQETDNQEAERRAFAARRGWPVVAAYRVTASGWQGAHRAAHGAPGCPAGGLRRALRVGAGPAHP